MQQRRRHAEIRSTSQFLGGFVFGLLLWLMLFGVRPSSSQVIPPEILSPYRIHPLPVSLLNWTASGDQGDYFDQIEPLKFGALIWSAFPIEVYVEAPRSNTLTEEVWNAVVDAALEAWRPYLPLQVTRDVTQADITIRAIAPPLKLTPSPPESATHRLSLERVRSAETRYELYLKPSGSGQTQLLHRCTIDVNPGQAESYLQAAIQHELGHALGLWGHSPNPEDTMFFSQVQQPQGISERDLNTLKRVYQQPTQLGWYWP